jgi:hypothetical protein
VTGAEDAGPSDPSRRPLLGALHVTTQCLPFFVKVFNPLSFQLNELFSMLLLKIIW